MLSRGITCVENPRGIFHKFYFVVCFYFINPLIGNEEEYVLVFFEDENRYAVVKTDKVVEKNFTFGDTVHVQWGRKKGARPYPAKLLFCGKKPHGRYLFLWML